LTTPEVQLALRLGGLPPAAHSPFAKIAPPAGIDSAIHASLYAKQVVNNTGALTESWRSLLACLASPTHRASLFLGSIDRWLTTEYYGAGGLLTGFVFDKDVYKITMPVAPEDLEVLGADWLSTYQSLDREEFEASFTPAELTVASAAGDAYREENMRLFLLRAFEKPGRFTRDQIVYEVEQAEKEDHRWLGGLLRKHAPGGFRPSTEHVNTGAASLAGRGLIEFHNELVAVTPALERLCTGTSSLNPYVLLRVVQAGQAEATTLVTMGLRGYWAFEFGRPASNEERCLVRCLDGPSVDLLLREKVSGLPREAQVAAPAAGWGSPMPQNYPPPASPTPAPSRAQNPPATPAYPPQQQPPVPPQAAYVQQPAAPQYQPPAAAIQPARPPEPTPRACAKCGNALKPGKKFCGSCGAPA